MNIRSINRQVKGDLIYIKAFSGAKSTQFNHYLLPTLEKYSYHAAIIHVGINDILRSKDSNDSNDLPENVIKVGKICQNHNIGKIFISGIIPSKRTNVDISNTKKKVHELRKKIILNLLNIHIYPHPVAIYGMAVFAGYRKDTTGSKLDK